MLNLNEIVIAGNLTTTPELKSTKGSEKKSVCNFSVAVNDRFDKEKPPIFFDVTAWEKAAEFLTTYGKKGSAVYVRGRMVQQTWTDKETQKERSKLAIVAADVQLLDRKPVTTEDENNS